MEKHAIQTLVLSVSAALCFCHETCEKSLQQLLVMHDTNINCITATQLHVLQAHKYLCINTMEYIKI